MFEYAGSSWPHLAFESVFCQPVSNVIRYQSGDSEEYVMSRIVIVGCALVLNALCSTVSASERLPSLSLVMDDDPRLTAPAIQYGLPTDWQKLWKDAVTAPEEDLRRAAATALMRLSQQDGTNIEQMNAAMLEGFRTTTDRVVSLSIAAALIQLDVREAAADLHQFARSGNIAVANRIEPALARWGFEPIQAEWVERIHEPTGVSATHLVLAVRGLAACGKQSAVPDLVTLAIDDANATEVRIAAATALGTLSNSGLTDVCQKLVSDQTHDGITNRLVAVKILARHDDDRSQQLLLEMAQDAGPAVAAVALERMLELNSQAVFAIRGELLENSDAKIRRLAAQSLVANSSAETVPELAELLNDRHPDVRSFVRESLEGMAKQDHLRDVVLQQATQIIGGEDWRGVEQAARLFGDLDYEPVSESLIALLEHERTEVFVTAAWALRELAVPETLPAILEFVQRRSSTTITTADNVCFTYLFEAFGQAKHAAADAVLRSFVPAGSGRQPVSRSAAIWALGHIHEENPPDDLVRQLSGRLSAAAGYPPSEVLEVGTAAAVSLGRMHVLAPLESAASIHGRGDLLYEACQWAIAQINGDEPPVTPPFRLAPRNPFLRPIER